MSAVYAGLVVIIGIIGVIVLLFLMPPFVWLVGRIVREPGEWLARWCEYWHE